MKKTVLKSIMIILVVATVIGMCVGLAACNKSVDDLSLIKERGKIIIGVTDYEPMDFVENGQWTGFDAEMAKLLGEELGVDVEFVEIQWEQKVSELKAKKIDLIWNGMTVTDELADNMDFSYSYARNYQACVIKSSKANTIKTKENVAASKIAVEEGSAGATQAATEFAKSNIIELSAQITALNEVAMGTSDVAIVDYTLAASKCGQGSFADLVMIDDLKYGEEEFAVGVRKNSNLTAKVNECLVKYYKNGKMTELKNEFGEDSIALCDLSNK